MGTLIHFFDIDIACEVGINAAVILQNIYYWCEKNRANGENLHDGLYWTYNSVRAFTELFPYMTEQSIRTALQKLIDAGYIKTGNFNKQVYDRTQWYAVTDNGKCILQNQQIHLLKTTNDICENQQMTFVKNNKPIPNNKPNNKPNSNSVFTPPTLEEVKEYCNERKNGVDAERFVDFYSSKGWMVGKNKMKDWKAAVRTWERDAGYSSGKAPKKQEWNFDPDAIELRAMMNDPTL